MCIRDSLIRAPFGDIVTVVWRGKFFNDILRRLFIIIRQYFQFIQECPGIAALNSKSDFFRTQALPFGCENQIDSGKMCIRDRKYRQENR